MPVRSPDRRGALHALRGGQGEPWQPPEQLGGRARAVACRRRAAVPRLADAAAAGGRCPSRAAAPRWLLRAACSLGALALAAHAVAAPQASWVSLPRPTAQGARGAWGALRRGGRVRLAARGGDEEGEEPAPAPAPAPPPPPLTEIRAGDRFTGWLKHPVLTRGDKYSLIIEIGPGDNEGTWSIQRPTATEEAAPYFEGGCKVQKGSAPGEVLLKDLDTVLTGSMNDPAPGSISGRVAQCGLKWGGYFEAKLDIPEDSGGFWPFR